MRRLILPAAALLAVVLVVPGAALAQSRLYAVDGANQNPAPKLYELDPGDGHLLREIGPVGFAQVTAIAFDPITGVLYGATSSVSGTGEIITIDVDTGAGTSLGVHGLTRSSPDLAFAPSGLLYGWDEQGGDDLAAIDLTTGNATVVGNCGTSTVRTGLAIDTFGTAWVKDDDTLYTVDRETGVCTFSRTLSRTLASSLAFDDRGRLYSHDLTGSGADLFSVDAVTGQVTQVGSNGLADLSSLAFEPPPLAPLYAADGAGSNPSTLYRLDPRDGSVLQTIGAIGVDHVIGLAFHPVSGVLYGTSSNDLSGTGELLTLNLETGAGSAVGFHGFGTSDLAFAPSGLLYGWSADTDDLLAFDLGAGTAAVVGSCGTATTDTGLAIDAAGAAFVEEGGDVYAIDRVTGACTNVESGVLSADDALAFGPRGSLYTVVRTGGGAEVHALDVKTGATRLVGSNSLANLAALAFRPPPLPPLYATDGGNANASTLYRLDPRDGSVIATIGPIGFDHVTGLSFHPTTGALYGQSGFQGTQELIAIDVTTGAGTAIGSTGLARGTPDLDFAPSGALYGWDEGTGGSDDAVTFDLGSGLASSPLGDCGVATERTGVAVDVRGVGFASLGVAGTLYGFDRNTGSCTLITSLSRSIANSLTFASGGTPFAIDRGIGSGELMTVDTETGDVISLGSNALGDLSAIAFRPPRPSRLYAVDGGNAHPASLYLLDEEDASITWILGPTGFDHVTSLAFHPVTGNLYGESGTIGTQELLAIDPATGAATAIGSTGLAQGSPDLAFAPSGILYGWDKGSGASDDLIRFDLTTGAASAPVGNCGTSTGSIGIAIDREGEAVVLSAGSLYSVDRSTGACTLGAAVGSHRNTLVFDGRDRLLGVSGTFPPTLVFSIDRATGATSPIGFNDLDELSALAYRPPPLPPLYATDGAGGNPSTLYRLDARDGSVIQTLGAIGFDHVTGLEFSPARGGPLFGVSPAGVSGLGPAELLGVDRATGAGATVGATGISDGTPDLSFAPDGTLYGWSEDSDDLVVFDQSSGTASLVGAPLSCGSSNRTGLAIDSLGNAYMKSDGDLHQVDLDTGACPFAVSLAAPGTLHNLLEFSPLGTLYTGRRSGGGVSTLYTADPTTGDVIEIGSNAIADLSAITFLPEPSGPLGLAAAALLLAALGRVRRSRDGAARELPVVEPSRR